MSRVSLFEVILAQVQTVYHIPPRLVLTLMSESWRAPLVSSCVAKAIPCKSKGQEGGSVGRGAAERGFSCIDVFFFFFFKSRCCERENTWHWIYSKHFHVFFTYINSISSRKKRNVSLRESILFNWTLWRRVNDSHKLYCVWNHLIAMCSSALR